MALESKMPPDDALEAAREWLSDQRLLRVAPATQDCLVALILRREREAKIDMLRLALRVAGSASTWCEFGVEIGAEIAKLEAQQCLAALDKPVREEEPVMPGVNTEVPDVADD